jgi:hypothetical protein
MHRRTLVLAIPAAAAVALTTAATAGAAPHVTVKTYRLSAALAPAPHVKGAAHARGRFTGTITIRGAKGTLAWRLAFSGLSGPATAAHIHLAPSGRVLIPLCTRCRTGQHGSFSGALAGRSTIMRAILGAHTYVNVHTSKNPAGEIRGVLHAVLETKTT